MGSYKKTTLLQSDIFSHLSSMGYLPRWGVLLMDLFLSTIAFAMSYLIGMGIFKYGSNQMVMPIWGQLLLLLGVQLVFFWIFHTYSGILRYSTFIDTIKVLLAVVSTGLVLLVSNLIVMLTWHYNIFLNTVAVIYIFIAFMLLFCLRVFVKTLFETVQLHASNIKKVLIYGTKSAGIAIAKMLRSSGDSMYRPVGFIDDSKNRQTYHLLGLKVYTLNEDLIRRMKAMNVRNVIVSPIKMREINPSTDLAIFMENNIHVLTTPYFTEYDQEGIDLQNARIGRIDSIQIEDLLERATIDIDTENARMTLQDNVVLVTGAAGSIGSELVKQIVQYQPKAIVLFEQAESPLHDLLLELKRQYPQQRFIPCIADVRNRTRVEEVFNEMRPDIVYHAAAYKHVPLMESHPNESIQANVMGTKNLADMAVKYEVKRFVMISTDKAVNPTNIMGASKRIAEIYVQSLFKQLEKQNPDCTKFITTRFGNVLGSNGSVIPYFKKQILAGGPVTVTHPDIIRYFMTIPEACRLVIEAGTLGNGGEIFVFDMGKPVKIVDLAKNMIRLAGFVPNKDIQIEFTGLRPGEKLYEELLNQKEKTLPTKNKKIMIAKVREFPFEQVSEDVEELIKMSYQSKPFSTVQLMKQLVPEFISRNSIYEQLDK